MNRTLAAVVNRTAAAAAMFLVALLCAFGTLRLAIHGREVAVPNLSGLSDADAAAAARKLGLSLSVENRFFSSAVPPNHVLSQLPLPGARVRRGWQVRVTESLGGQHVDVPDVTGQAERAASLILRRLQLEVGTIARLPAPAPAGIVLAQSPPPNSSALSGPQVSLLLSDPEDTQEAPAYVMPSLIGLTLGAASSRLSAGGLHIASATEPDNAPDPADVDPSSAPNPMDPSFDVPAPTISPDATITSQSPAPGHRVARGEAIRVVLARPQSAAPAQ